MMYQLVSKIYGEVPLRSVKPCYVLSTDDTIVYIFESKGSKDSKLRLVFKSGGSCAGHTSKCTIDNSNKMQGLRVKMTFTFSAVGVFAPIFINIYGLNEHEMPLDKSIHLENYVSEKEM